MSIHEQESMRRIITALERIIAAGEGYYDDENIIGNDQPHAYRVGFMLATARIAAEEAAKLGALI